MTIKVNRYTIFSQIKGAMLMLISLLYKQVYLQVESSVHQSVKLDIEFLQCMLVQILSQSIECIRNLFSCNSKSRHFVYEIIVTLRAETNASGTKFLNFEVIDSGLAYTSLANDIDWSFQESVCRRCLHKMNGFIKREEFSHHVYHNMVTFAIPWETFAVYNAPDCSSGDDSNFTPNYPPRIMDHCQHGDLVTGYKHCGGVYAELLSNHLRWHALHTCLSDPNSEVSTRIKPQKAIGSFSRNIMIVVEKQVCNALSSSKKC